MKEDSIYDHLEHESVLSFTSKMNEKYENDFKKLEKKWEERKDSKFENYFGWFLIIAFVLAAPIPGSILLFLRFFRNNKTMNDLMVILLIAWIIRQYCYASVD